MNERKQAFKQGTDGRLYFTFNLSAEYTLLPPFSAPFTYRVVECGFDEETETEYFRIESAGGELPLRFTVKQLNFMISQLPHELTFEGESVELPLLQSEVKAFYAAKRSELKKANVAENEKVKGTAWNSNLQAIKGVRQNLCYATAQNDTAKMIELATRLDELNAEQTKILQEKGADERILRKVPDCDICGDTGITNGKICDCARANEEKIKVYNALKRLYDNPPQLPCAIVRDSSEDKFTTSSEV